MNFIEAVKLAKEGKRIRSIEWFATDYIYVRNGRFIDESNDQYVPSVIDMLDEDWEVYEEKPKTYSFQEAFNAFNRGKVIRRLCKPYDIFIDNINLYKQTFSYDDITATDWLIVEPESMEILGIRPPSKRCWTKEEVDRIK